MSGIAFIGLLKGMPGAWIYVLAAISIIVLSISTIWISWHRSRVSLARVEADRTTKLYELETARQEMLLKIEIHRELIKIQHGQSETPVPLTRVPERKQIPSREAEAA